MEEDEITFSGKLKDQPAIKVSDTEGADFLVALSALSSYASTTTTNTQALDIVMVLDASGSMKDSMSKSDKTKRMDALKTAVNAFIDSAAAQNANITDKEKEIQLSIVKFAGEYRKAVGNDTNLLGDNYSQIVKDLTVCNAANAPDLKKEVNKIKPGGATRADYGLQHAQTVLNNARPNAKKVVIFFTDGSPNNGGGFDNSIASKAIETAKSLKAAGAEVYTVGIFDDADPKADVSGASKENKFMQAVSSNYPSATYTKTGIIKYKWNFGDRPDNADYYMAASSADGLNKVFEDIFTSISTKPAGPTQVTDKPQKEGYVTFDDPLGDYMEVKSFEAVAFSDQVFTQVDKTSTDTADTYIFKGEHKDTVSGAYPNTADLSHIIITVTHGSGSVGDRVKVQIPASMLPLRYYKATSTDGTPKLEVNNAQPISVIYSVGLKDKENVCQQIASGKFTDPDLAAYVTDNAKNGKISFYSNKFDPNKKTADNKTIGLTTATFTPAISNNFYYHTENTLLYTKTGEGASATYKEATEVLPKQTYYYQLNYLQLKSPAHTDTVKETRWVPVSIATKQEIDDCIIPKDGKWYIKKDTKKGSLPSAIDNQLGDKKEEDGTAGNRTGTAQRRIDFQWDLEANKGVLYLGNNGKLTMNATGSLKVTKVVTADAGLTPNPNAEFTMKFELAGTNLDTNASYNYTVTGIEGTKPIKSGDTFTLKKDQTAEIVGLPAGSTYTITEETPPTGYTSNITHDGTGEVKAGTAQEVTVTNTYKPKEIEVKPADNNYPFGGAKILTGRDWKENDHFEFKLQAVTDDAPLPAEAGDKRYAECVVTDKTGTTEGTPVEFNFGKVTFTKPGEYVYDITEVIPTDNEDKIAGVSYDGSFYRVTVTIEDDGSGQLEMTDHTITKNGGTEKAETATFVNTYHADDVTVTLNATKKLNVVVGNRTLNKDDFSFNLSENGKVIKTATNEADGKVTFTLNFTSAVGQKTYVISEVNNHLGGIGYDTREYEVTFTVRDNGEGKLVASPLVYTLNGKLVVDGAQFVNTYTATAGDKVKFTPEATKVLTGRDLKKGEFHFIVTDENGTEVSTGTNNADGTVTFSPIGFNKTMTTYAALFADLPTEQPTEDEKPVVDEQPAENEQPTETEQPTATEQPTEDNQPDVHRQPALLSLTPDDNNGGEIAPTEEMQDLLTHWYTISEVKPVDANDGITYDPTVYTVCVKLWDKEGNGKLDIESITYYQADKTTPLGDGVTPTFRNSYAAADSDAVTITLQKNLTGRALNAGEFTFKLSCPEDAAHNGLTATNDASGKVTFALTYKDLDPTKSDAAPTAYTYTVSEVKGDAEGVSYDDQTYTFTVEVQDDGTGKMKAALTEVPASMTFTNTYTPKATPTPTVTPSQEPSAAPAPTATPAPTAAPKPVATATPAPMTHIPQTADTFPLALLIAILAISGGAIALLIVGKKRKK